MQNQISELETLKNYITSLIDGYKNQLETTKKVNLKKQIEAQIYTCNSILGYLQDRKDVLTGEGKWYK
jgi:succinylglutamate desuccinylase